jgi:hypothetical protein
VQFEETLRHFAMDPPQFTYSEKGAAAEQIPLAMSSSAGQGRNRAIAVPLNSAM